MTSVVHYCAPSPVSIYHHHHHHLNSTVCAECVGLVVANSPGGLCSFEIYQCSNYEVNHGWVYPEREGMHCDSRCNLPFASPVSRFAYPWYEPVNSVSLWLACGRMSLVSISIRNKSLLSKSVGSPFFGGKLAGAWSWTFLPSADVNNGWSYTSAFPVSWCYGD
jgi:hypothetical protein